MSAPRIAIACATARGLRLFEKLVTLAPAAELFVISFREQASEPPFFDAIRDAAAARGAGFLEARRLDRESWLRLTGGAEIDLLFAVSWRYLIPPEVYTTLRRGSYVFHDSLLPEYRGHAPTVWAIANGLDHTGATLFQITERTDAGPIVGQQRIAIGPHETIADVMPRVTDAYVSLLSRHLSDLLDGTAPLTAQDEAAATTMPKRTPADNVLDWGASAASVFNLTRAVSRPYAGAQTSLRGEPLRVWTATAFTADDGPAREPGRVLGSGSDGCVVQTGRGTVTIAEVQRVGQTRCGAGSLLTAGDVLGR